MTISVKMFVTKRGAVTIVIWLSQRENIGQKHEISLHTIQKMRFSTREMWVLFFLKTFTTFLRYRQFLNYKHNSRLNLVRVVSKSMLSRQDTCSCHICVNIIGHTHKTYVERAWSKKDCLGTPMPSPLGRR